MKRRLYIILFMLLAAPVVCAQNHPVNEEVKKGIQCMPFDSVAEKSTLAVD